MTLLKKINKFVVDNKFLPWELYSGKSWQQQQKVTIKYLGHEINEYNQFYKQLNKQVKKCELSWGKIKITKKEENGERRGMKEVILFVKAEK